MDRYRLLSIIIVPGMTCTMGIVRRFYTGGGDGGDGCQGCGLYSLDDRSGGKRQTEKQVEVVMA